MKQTDLFEKIIVDNFAGGGGASTGIELACGQWCGEKITTMERLGEVQTA